MIIQTLINLSVDSEIRNLSSAGLKAIQANLPNREIKKSLPAFPISL